METEKQEQPESLVEQRDGLPRACRVCKESLVSNFANVRWQRL